MTKADAALDRLCKWAGDSEPDLYPYLKDFFVEVLGYPRESVRINSAQKKGIPDITLISKDSIGKLQFPWVVCEVKREREIFADLNARKEVLDTQLRRYVTADTVYALLIDPGTIAVYLPDLRETKIVKLKEMNVQNLQNAGDPQTLAFLNYENSTSEKALTEFREGLTPTGYLSVVSGEDQQRFHDALKVSARELIEYASARLHGEKEEYGEFSTELQSMKAWRSGKTSLLLREAKLRAKYANAIRLLKEYYLNLRDRSANRLQPTRRKRQNMCPTCSEAKQLP